ncbi:ABC transporter substrate-binding protein [Glaciibacter psychrotolerans]|uniref:Ribose transport system substrate-binding protein n=1 Tax=Glaciibacter psychrotolerans TaxID=670054 RepID=A0A7Z0EGM8_9MICO|nr:ABC transporter substrate-binding protein [Leifsonia psychrotolerans]NYJ21296.1 ribose transport system substrate-binding protein [Leifsonia psychrotolerans]
MFSRVRKTLAIGAAAAIVLTLGACSADASAEADGPATAGVAENLKVGWSTIYLSPSWMQQTEKLLNEEAGRLKDQGIVASIETLNANGDTSQQIAQIRTMIQQKYDIILVDAGSSTALNPVMEDAIEEGITVVNFDSLVTSDKVTKVGTDQGKWGGMLAQWLVDELDGKGDIIAFNGPAGVAVSEDRWAGAKAVFDKNPDIKIVTTLNSEYNIAPAAQAFASAYAANPDIDGVFAQGGALGLAALQTLIKRDAPMIPITGENYNGFLKAWSDNIPNGFSSMSTAQPNWMSAVALRAAVAIKQGKDIPKWIEIPLPEITNDNLTEFVKTGEPDDSYPINEFSDADIKALLGL